MAAAHWQRPCVARASAHIDSLAPHAYPLALTVCPSATYASAAPNTGNSGINAATKPGPTVAFTYAIAKYDSADATTPAKMIEPAANGVIAHCDGSGAAMTTVRPRATVPAT